MMRTCLELLSLERLKILRCIAAKGPVAAAEMVRSVPGLNTNGIYMTLRRMEKAGLVRSCKLKRNGSPGAAPRVYRITVFGGAVLNVTEELERVLARKRKGTR